MTSSRKGVGGRGRYAKAAVVGLRDVVIGREHAPVDRDQRGELRQARLLSSAGRLNIEQHYPGCLEYLLIVLAEIVQPVPRIVPIVPQNG